MNSIESIRNFVQLTPEIGTAGQPLADQFQIIADAGFETVINIAMPDHADSIDDEGRRVTELVLFQHDNYGFSVPVVFRSTKSRRFRRGAVRRQWLNTVCIVAGLMEPQWQAMMDLDQQELFDRCRLR